MARSIRSVWLAAAVAFVSGWLSASVVAQPQPGFADFRSIFIDRFDYTYNSPDIPAMTSAIHSQMQNAADMGFTDVIWQVRGEADALYNSNVEPHIAGLTPGFDPLQVAIDAAHARGLKLHAWLNATPLWRGTTTPPAGHIFHNTDPSFRLMDINGNLEPASGWSNYSSVNPVLPEVHEHINSVVDDVASSYDVDGIHLDYIRYVPGALNFDRLPHDPIAHQMFQQATGLDGSNPANFPAYKDYVKNRITDLVRSIKQTVDAAEVREGRVVELTASVWRDPDVGENEYIQDYRTWIEDELLDVAMPMIYLSALNDHIYFDANLQNTLNILDYSGSSTRVSPNLASYLHMDPSRGGGVDLTISELQRAYDFGAHGAGLYDYTAVFSAYSAADRQRIIDFYDSLGDPPPPPGPPGPGNVLDDFEVDEGRFNWNYGLSPQTTGLAGGPGNSTAPSDRVTTEHQGLGTGSQLLNLTITVEEPLDPAWQLRHNSGIGAPAVPSANIPLEPTGYVGFWLKTDDPGITVRLAIDDPVPAGATALEIGIPLNVVADNQWHLYQWSFEDDSHWDVFPNAGSNGAIDAVNGTVTIDSIWFNGSGDAQIYLDTVSHNPAGMLAAYIPGDYDRNGKIEAADSTVWQAAYGSTVLPGSGADGNGDGIVDVGDWLVWRKAMSPPAGSPAASDHATPEPASAVTTILVAAVLCLARRR